MELSISPLPAGGSINETTTQRYQLAPTGSNIRPRRD
jgi:hypothetical protein